MKIENCDIIYICILIIFGEITSNIFKYKSIFPLYNYKCNNIDKFKYTHITKYLQASIYDKSLLYTVIIIPISNYYIYKNNLLELHNKTFKFIIYFIFNYIDINYLNFFYLDNKILFIIDNKYTIRLINKLKFINLDKNNNINNQSDNINTQSDNINTQSDNINTQSNNINTQSDNINIQTGNINLDDNCITKSDNINLDDNCITKSDNINLDDNCITKSDNINLDDNCITKSDNINLDDNCITKLDNINLDDNINNQSDNITILNLDNIMMVEEDIYLNNINKLNLPWLQNINKNLQVNMLIYLCFFSKFNNSINVIYINKNNIDLFNNLHYFIKNNNILHNTKITKFKCIKNINRKYHCINFNYLPELNDNTIIDIFLVNSIKSYFYDENNYLYIKNILMLFNSKIIEFNNNYNKIIKSNYKENTYNYKTFRTFNFGYVEYNTPLENNVFI